MTGSAVRPLIVLDHDHIGDALTALKAINEGIPRFLNEDEKAALCELAELIDEQVKPPKPAEPTGRYAVVENRDGIEFCKIDPVTNGTAYVWQRLGQPTSSAASPYYCYDDIDVVRVLSEGVTA